ncbi:hypothetical protein AVEN_18146-1 [Araneus ventricosus]|uniref:Uncharacterized protein n=1 Tax=Araneus ventricosus TaxID=182803 RepID=A0A4Y2AIG5_ARAVE|nr:hypothetical protein AVEN_18146-1 [Araneus ventricosus]
MFLLYSLIRTFFSFLTRSNRGGLVVKSWLHSRRALGSKSPSTDDPPCLRAWCTLKMVWVKRPPTGVMQKFGVEDASSGVVLVI